MEKKKTTIEYFPLRSGKRQGYPLSLSLVNLLEELTNTVGKERVRGIKIAKEEKLSLFADITISLTSC